MAENNSGETPQLKVGRENANRRAAAASATNAKALDKDPSKFSGGVDKLGDDDEAPPAKTAKEGMPLGDYAKAAKADSEAYTAWSARRGNRLKTALTK